jgi:hypothetical protein
MSCLLPILLLLLTLVSAHAQQQERKLLDRITKPDRTITYDFRKSSYSGGKASSVPKDAGIGKQFSFEQHVIAKPFGAKSFGGEKTAWFGKFNFTTKSAPTKGKFDVANADKNFDTKTKAVSAAPESSKTKDTRRFAASGQSFFRRGPAQDRFDKEGAPTTDRPVGYSGDLKPLTIDDVRNILNKPKLGSEDRKLGGPSGDKPSKP